ncbi:GNAT family N-acetyltransferase [Bacillus bingmayongensis]|uniref:GNAT family N-acetyltransferase n=1 Tax=Bacillus bingmayongensis TaxID=1150157 RepID=UPI0028BF2423|nr:GNAT family N-acetyltransferase [Bacillus bingmayongensis]
MQLVKPTYQHSKQIMAYRQTFLNSREQPHGSCSLQHFDSINKWLEKVKIQENGENLPPNRVPSTQFLSFEKGKLVGFINIRHRLTPELLIESGHISYSVHPDERRKGYATEQLRLSLFEAKKLGLEKVLITCDKANIASAKTIQKVGGILEDEVISPNTGEIVQRYWIEL